MGTFATTTALQVKMVGTNFDTATSALASACIQDAENEIRKQLADQYDTSADYFQTSTSVPPMVRTLCENLSVAYMYECMARGGKESYQRSDRLLNRCMENLKQLAEGTLQLVDTLGAQIVPENTKWQVASSTTDYAPTFAEDNPKRWKVDPNKLEDISDARGNPSDSYEIE